MVVWVSLAFAMVQLGSTEGSLLRKWKVLGPFIGMAHIANATVESDALWTVGKTEYDGDPVQSEGGIDAVLMKPKIKLPSELSETGYVSWQSMESNSDGK